MTGEELARLTRRVEDELWTGRAKLARWEVSDRRRALAARHPLLFGWVYFPEWFTKTTPEFHWDIVDLYLHSTRVAIAAPVGSAKTTVLTKCCSIWSMLFEPWCRDILIVSASEDLISVWIDDMGRKIKANDELREDFGECWGTHWGSRTLEFIVPTAGGKRRHKFIRSVGRAGTIRGRRPDRIILDDPEDEISVKSEMQREDYQTWFWGPLVNRLDEPHKCLTYVGTCMHPDAFLVSLLLRPPSGWITRSYAMLDDKEKSIWEEKWPTDFLRQRREEIGEERFLAEFMNQPVRNWHQRIFDVTRIQQAVVTWSVDDLVTLCIDPAFQHGGDAWALTVVAVDGTGRWKVLEAKKARTGTEGWLEAMWQARERFPRLYACGIEAGGGQGALEYTVPAFMLRHGINLPLVWIKHSPRGGKKSARIAQLQPVVNGGRLTILPHLVELYRELEMFRTGLERQEDHLIDSLAMHLEVQQPRTPEGPAPEPTIEELRHRRYLAYKAAWDRARAARNGVDVLGMVNPARARLERYE